MPYANDELPPILRGAGEREPTLSSDGSKSLLIGYLAIGLLAYASLFGGKGSRKVW